MRVQSVTPTPVHSPAMPNPRVAPSKPFSSHVARTKKASNSGGTASTPNPVEGASATATTNANASQAASSSSSAASASSPDAGVQSSLDQSEDQNIEFLQLQSQMNTQSETFTTLSNVMKTENDTIKNTAGNMAL